MFFKFKITRSKNEKTLLQVNLTTPKPLSWRRKLTEKKHDARRLLIHTYRNHLLGWPYVVTIINEGGGR